MRTFGVLVVVVVVSRVAAADPDPVPMPPTLTLQTIPMPPPLMLQTTLFDEPTPPPPVPSLRLEAARVAQERFAEQWRYPEPGTLGGYDGTGVFWGHGHYRPRSRRAKALHAGSIGATLLGEVLLSTGSPLAGVGALATGATLDAAAADADRDAEANRKR